MAPPPEFSDDEGEDKKQNSPKTSKTPTPKKQTDDKVDDSSETISGSKKSNSGKKDEVLIEIDGQFQLVSADDVRAKDLGYVLDQDKNKENEKKQNEKNKTKLQPAPPGKPRPSTANSSSRRNIRSAPAKQRPQSAHGATEHRSSNYDSYNSPYALSPREKQLMEDRKKALEKQKQENERKRREEEQNKEKENQEAFEFWLKKKRENDRRRKIHEEEERKKNAKEDRVCITFEDRLLTIMYLSSALPLCIDITQGFFRLRGCSLAFKFWGKISSKMLKKGIKFTGVSFIFGENCILKKFSSGR